MMKLKVTFREYAKPADDPDTGEPERGEYLGSFEEIIEGVTPLEIMAKAGERADTLSTDNDTDVRVWEVPITFTPRGIVSE